MPPPLARPDLGWIQAAPNLLTLAGYGCAIAWFAGAPWPFAVASILADHLDGKLARATGATSDFGGKLDHVVDLTLTGAVAYKLGPLGLAMLPMATLMQAATYDDSMEDSYFTWRSVMMGMSIAGLGG